MMELRRHIARSLCQYRLRSKAALAFRLWARLVVCCPQVTKAQADSPILSANVQECLDIVQVHWISDEQAQTREGNQDIPFAIDLNLILHY